MRTATRTRPSGAWLMVAALVSASAVGCQQDNNAEFLKTAPPGPPNEHPNDTFAERKARTYKLSAAGKRAEAAAAKAKLKAKAP